MAEAPGERPRADAYTMLSGGTASLGLAADGPWPWAALPPTAVHPALVLTMPNYRLSVLGSPSGPAAVSALLDGIGRWRRARGIRSVAVLYACEEPGHLLTALRGAGARMLPLARECFLDITWRDFDGYLATLPSKRRVGVRRELRALAEAGTTVRQIHAEDHLDELIRLRCQLVAKYGGTPDAAKERAFFGRVRDTFGPGALTTFATEHAGRLMSFGLFVRDGDHWTALLTGSDYRRPQARLGYFATLFYAPARTAPTLGITAVGYGLGSWQAKTSRGCRTSMLWAAATVPGEDSAL
ncbi:GNAT family N-acetyltransferase [Streptomyces sp. SP18CS02]|uniref:GNAT family N-acetyltransferase n=1 Tax=Streptomyces sp. SP18CS02 TaxID=3002531 RepID=UPI002E76775E|nr:GNAT family N-acetyltransferase [Streptomyces sp. SP18CS02]MEE1752749.1 GNAT family N-acetyltransferase [Streptomyces sp. SP18CS02]